MDTAPGAGERVSAGRFTCWNCGACCGPVPVTRNEWDAIKQAVKRMPPGERRRLQNQRRQPLTCPFRDIEKKRCSIYRVRPLLCRMYGHYPGLECSNNPDAVDGTRAGARTLMTAVYGKAAMAGVMGVNLGWDFLKED